MSVKRVTKPDIQAILPHRTVQRFTGIVLNLVCDDTSLLVINDIIYLSLRKNHLRAAQEKINLGHSEIYLDDNGIVVVKGSDHVYTLADVKALHVAILSISNNQKCLTLLLGSRYTLMDNEARDFLSSKAAASNFIANAYVIHSTVQRMIINFVVSIKGTPIPARFFSNETDAVKWLKTFQ